MLNYLTLTKISIKHIADSILIFYFCTDIFNINLTYFIMKYFVCYVRSTLASEEPYVIVTESEVVKDKFLYDAFISDVDDATYKIIDLD